MSSKLNFEKINRLRHGTKSICGEFIDVSHDEDEYITRPYVKMNLQGIGKNIAIALEELIQKATSPELFLGSLDKRKKVLQKISILHNKLCAPKICSGYINSPLYRKAKWLLELNNID